MSITLITGVPGSGKTLYAISNLLRPFIGQTVPQEIDGVTTIHPRTIYTNINGLLIDHELIDAGDNEGLRDWHQWARPGAVICFDEFQKAWPPRPNGSKVPDDIQALDTHRHMGVDFILITQNCMNVDRHILGLVDRHLHVRRVANMGMAVVYEWDHASKSLLYKNAMTKAPWRFDKNVFKLYKSAEVHTKQKRKMPGLVWFILMGFAAAAYAIPSLKSRLTERINGKPPEVATVAADPDKLKPGQKMEYVKDGIQYTVESAVIPPVAPASAPAVVQMPEAPTFAGCVSSGDKCTCYDATAKPVQVEPGVCSGMVQASSVVPKAQINEFFKRVPDIVGPVLALDQSASDASVLSFMAGL
jgi:zona occludens toxin